jgi:GT2 family glycosyltransferase
VEVLVCIVNYRTDDALCELVASLNSAWNAAGAVGKLAVLVLDNSGKLAEDASRFARRLVALHADTELAFAHGNLGYFGVLPLAQARATRERFEYVLFGNADLVVAPDFFRALQACRGAAAILAPSIVVTSLGGEMDQNPAYESRLSRQRLRFLRTVYGSAFLFAVYRMLWRARDRLRARAGGPATEPVTLSVRRKIYAAHGALFIFADLPFFQSLTGFKPFLFGEELFVAEEARRAGLETLYVPELRVRHSRSKSISLIPQDGQRKYLFEALTFLLNRYHDDSSVGS